MKLSLSYDDAAQAWFLTGEDVRIETRANLEEWEATLSRELEKLGGKRAFILIDISDFHLSPSLAEEYCRVAKAVVSEHALGIVRYGHADVSDMTTTAIRIGAVLNRFPANVFPNREAALKVLERIRSIPPATSG